MKYFYAFLVCGFVAMCASSGWADASVSVVERTDCADLKSRIDTLSAVDDMDEETSADLAQLQARYRSDCMVRAGGRRSSGRADAAVAVSKSDAASTVNDDVDYDVSYDVADTYVAVQSETNNAPVRSPEEAAALIESGFCVNGERPNKFGCCGDEKFTDMGNLVFACCPPDGGDCFPPIK